jgi:hypothetical protein
MNLGHRSKSTSLVLPGGGRTWFNSGATHHLFRITLVLAS